MGLFDFLKSSKNKEESVVKTNTRTRIDPSNSMPTVKPDKEIFSMPGPTHDHSLHKLIKFRSVERLQVRF